MVLLENLLRKGEKKERREAVSQSISRSSFVYQYQTIGRIFDGWERLGITTNLWTFRWVMQRCSAQPPIYWRWPGDGDVLHVEPQLPAGRALDRPGAPFSTGQPANRRRRGKEKPRRDRTLNLKRQGVIGPAAVQMSNFLGLIPEP